MFGCWSPQHIDIAVLKIKEVVLLALGVVESTHTRTEFGESAFHPTAVLAYNKEPKTLILLKVEPVADHFVQLHHGDITRYNIFPALEGRQERGPQLTSLDEHGDGVSVALSQRC